MSIQEIADAIGWPTIFWFVGLLNPLALGSQLWTLCREKKTDGISVAMFALFLVIQLGFLFEGLRVGSVQMVMSMGLSAIISASIIIVTLVVRPAR